MTSRAFVVKVVSISLLFFLSRADLVLAAEIELTRINACRDIAEAFSRLQRPISSCGNATGVIERAIRDLSVGSEVQICFMERPPLASLSGFSCFRSSFRSGRDIACFRSTSAELLADYQANFAKRYSARASSYIEEAKKCPGSNGDASRIIETTFPPILTGVAAHEFGFNVQYGDTKPGRSMVSHGFARTSPDVSKRGPDAIEYVVFSDGMTSESIARTTYGNWSLSIDSSPDVAAQFSRALKRNGIDTFISFVDIDMQLSPRAPTVAKEPSLPHLLSDVVVARWEDEGFKEMDDEDIAIHTGKSREEISDAFLLAAPFGARNLLGDRERTFRILMKTSGLSCTKGGRGAIGAYLLVTEGEKDVLVDFGSVAAIVAGINACASSANSSREYIRNLAEESKQVILDELRGR